MENRESPKETRGAVRSWLWELVILGAVLVLVVLALTARELPASRRYLRREST